MLAGYKIVPPVPGTFVAGHPPVALDVFASSGIVTGATNLVPASLTVGSSLANGALIALIENSNTLTVSSVAYTAGSGGAWTLFNGYFGGGGNRRFDIYYSLAPAAGATTVRATLSGNIGAFDGLMGLYSLYNVDQATPLDGYLTDAGSSLVSLTTTLTAGGMILGALCGAGAITPIVTGTQDFSNVNNDFWVMGHNSASGTLTWTTPANGRGMNIANVRAA